MAAAAARDHPVSAGPPADRRTVELGEKLRQLQDAEHLLALGIDTLHGELGRTCEEINRRLDAADGGGRLQAKRWAYNSWVWFRGRAILTLGYAVSREPDDPTSVLARCTIVGADGRVRTTLSLVRTGPASAAWRIGPRTPSMSEFLFQLLERETEESLREYGRP